MTINFNYMAHIPCASNTGPRKFARDYIENGHGGMWDRYFSENVLAMGAGWVTWWMPGGCGQSPLLEWDSMSQCRTDKAVSHLGSVDDLAYAITEAKKIGRKTAIYTGATIPLDSAPIPTTKIYEMIYDEFAPYKGILNAVIIDCGCEAMADDAYPIAQKALEKLGIECWAETRALIGKYSHTNKHTHYCTSGKWESSGGIKGDRYHAPDNGKTWVLSTDTDPYGTAARNIYSQLGRVSVGVWEKHITSAIVCGTERLHA